MLIKFSSDDLNPKKVKMLNSSLDFVTKWLNEDKTITKKVLIEIPSGEMTNCINYCYANSWRIFVKCLKSNGRDSRDSEDWIFLHIQPSELWGVDAKDLCHSMKWQTLI